MIAACTDGVIRSWKYENAVYKINDKIDLLDYVTYITDLSEEERNELKRPYKVRY